MPQNTVLLMCSNCGAPPQMSPPKAHKQCARCHGAYYCCRDCQIEAWPAHREICGQVAAQWAKGDEGASINRLFHRSFGMTNHSLRHQEAALWQHAGDLQFKLSSWICAQLQTPLTCV